MVEGDVSDQARQALTNMKAILEEAGSSMEKVSKVTVLLTDMAVFSQVNAVYKTFFSADPKPARACFAVKALPAGGEYNAVLVTRCLLLHGFLHSHACRPSPARQPW